MSEITVPGINVELLTIGIADMRSGRFKKGVGALHRIIGNEPGPGDEHCCLGCLSITAKENGCPVTSEIVGSGIERREMFGSQQNELLSDEVQTCYGFESNNPGLLTPDGRMIPAAQWNDRGSGGEMLRPRPEEDFGPIAEAFQRTYLPNG